MADISSDDLRSKIRGMLKGADLDKVTAKTVRVQLEAEFKTSFDARKKEINQIINNIINESSSSSSSDDEIEDMHPVIKKQDKKQTKSVDSKTAAKKEAKSGSAISSSNDSDDDDEAIARKLQEEEMGGRRTRSGGKNKKPIKRKSKKDDNDSSSKKRKTTSGGGYMKPLPLSPELADFTGETEMPRHAVVKRVWDYCKENNLMDPRNKQFAICDEKLQRLVGVKRFRMFGMMKLLGKHFIPDK